MYECARHCPELNIGEVSFRSAKKWVGQFLPGAQTMRHTPIDDSRRSASRIERDSVVSSEYTHQAIESGLMLSFEIDHGNFYQPMAFTEG